LDEEKGLDFGWWRLRERERKKGSQMKKLKIKKIKKANQILKLNK
jgi:hypothetical protein